MRCKGIKTIEQEQVLGEQTPAVFFIVMFEIISMKELPGKLHF
jgi:hypothetical protein